MALRCVARSVPAVCRSRPVVRWLRVGARSPHRAPGPPARPASPDRPASRRLHAGSCRSPGEPTHAPAPGPRNIRLAQRAIVLPMHRLTRSGDSAPRHERWACQGPPERRDAVGRRDTSDGRAKGPERRDAVARLGGSWPALASGPAPANGPARANGSTVLELARSPSNATRTCGMPPNPARATSWAARLCGIAHG